MMLKAIRLSVLLLTLTGAARAGEVIIPPALEPVETRSAQEMPANNEDTAVETGTLTGIALTLLVSLLP